MNDELPTLATARATYEAKNDQWEGFQKDPSAGCPDKNVHGTYPFNRPELPGRLRDLRDPYADDDQEQ